MAIPSNLWGRPVWPGGEPCCDLTAAERLCSSTCDASQPYSHARARSPAPPRSAPRECPSPDGLPRPHRATDRVHGGCTPRHGAAPGVGRNGGSGAYRAGGQDCPPGPCMPLSVRAVGNCAVCPSPLFGDSQLRPDPAVLAPSAGAPIRISERWATVAERYPGPRHEPGPFSGRRSGLTGQVRRARSSATRRGVTGPCSVGTTNCLRPFRASSPAPCGPTLWVDWSPQVSEEERPGRGRPSGGDAAQAATVPSAIAGLGNWHRLQEAADGPQPMPGALKL